MFPEEHPFPSGTWYKDRSRQDIRGRTAIHDCSMHQFAFPTGLSTYSLMSTIKPQKDIKSRPWLASPSVFLSTIIHTSLVRIFRATSQTKTDSQTTSHPSHHRLRTFSSLQLSPTNNSTMCIAHVFRYLRCGHQDKPMILDCRRQKNPDGTCPGGIWTEYEDFNTYCPADQQYVLIMGLSREYADLAYTR
jgi:hypothetical protein